MLFYRFTQYASGNLLRCTELISYIIYITEACIFYVFPVIIQGVLWSLTLSVGKSLSETLGMAQAAKLLDALGAVFSAVISVALCVSAIYIISTAVVLMSGGGAS